MGCLAIVKCQIELYPSEYIEFARSKDRIVQSSITNPPAFSLLKKERKSFVLFI